MATDMDINKVAPIERNPDNAAQLLRQAVDTGHVEPDDFLQHVISRSLTPAELRGASSDESFREKLSEEVFFSTLVDLYNQEMGRRDRSIEYSSVGKMITRYCQSPR